MDRSGNEDRKPSYEYDPALPRDRWTPPPAIPLGPKPVFLAAVVRRHAALVARLLDSRYSMVTRVASKVPVMTASTVFWSNSCPGSYAAR